MADIYISFDIEATGEKLGVCPISSIGACLVDEYKKKTFYKEIKPYLKGWTAKGILVAKYNKLPANTSAKQVLNYLQRGGIPIETALRGFNIWLKKMMLFSGCPKATPILVLSPASFDLYGLLKAYELTGIQPVTTSCLDFKNYAMGVRGTRSVKSVRKKVLKNVLKNNGVLCKLKHTHHALEDAQEQAELFRGLQYLAVLNARL